jgi:chemotaxis protein CheX
LITIISDAFTGSISLCFDKRTFLNICENMLGDTYSEIDEEVEDAAAELLNIIFGKAKTDLNDKSGYNLKKAIPTIIKGPGIRVKQTTQPAIILPFESDAGTFTLEVELSEHGGV